MKKYRNITKVIKIFFVSLLSVSVVLSCACRKISCGPEPTQRPGDDLQAVPTGVPEKPMQEILDSLSEIEFTEAKNVILFIGDGMGKNHIPATKAIFGAEYGDKLAIEYLTNHGTSMTICVEGEPDSASGGTALSTGYKSKRKYLGLDADGNTVQNVVELAKSLGKKTGVVTDEDITDATPAAFTVHWSDRNDTADIVKLQIDNCPDLLIGGGLSAYEETLSNFSEYADKIKNNGITWAKSWAEVNAFESGKLIATIEDGCFAGISERSVSLAEMTEKAIELLEDDEDGFFLMVEGGAMDGTAHESDLMETCRQVISFDEAVSVGIRYACENPDTIVIVTADHNTGGLETAERAGKMIAANKSHPHVVALLQYEAELQKNNPEVVLSELPYRFTTIGHTNDNVDIFAIGYGTEIFNEKRVKSSEIGAFIGRVLGDANFGENN